MTQESQTFISPEDLIAIILHCPCGVKLSIPLNADSPKSLANLHYCPNCEQEWFQGNQDQRLIVLRGFAERTVAIQKVNHEFQVKIKLEIPSDALDREANDRA